MDLSLILFVKSKAATTLPPIQTSQYKEIITRLEYLHQIKGFGLLTGNPGVGENNHPSLLDREPEQS